MIKRRGQILPFFVLYLVFVLTPLLALLIDGAGLIAAQREASALAWRGARFAAAEVALACGQKGSTTLVGSNCVYGSAGTAILGTASGKMNSYLTYWLNGGPERIGLAFTKVSQAAVVAEGTDALRAKVRVCYAAIFVKFPDSMKGGCASGELEVASEETASVLISN